VHDGRTVSVQSPLRKSRSRFQLAQGPLKNNTAKPKSPKPPTNIPPDGEHIILPRPSRTGSFVSAAGTHDPNSVQSLRLPLQNQKLKLKQD